MKLLFIVFFSMLSVGPTALGQKKSLFIDEPKANEAVWLKAHQSGVKTELFEAFQTLPSSISTSVNATGKYDVVARGDELAKLFEEQELGQTGAVARGSAAKINQLTGAAFAVFPMITDFGYGTGDSSSRLTGRTRETEEARISCNLKMINTTTGKTVERSIVITERNTVISRQTNISSGLIQTLVNKLAEEIVNKLVDETFPARIVGMIGKQITINRGDGLGVKPGQIWKVFALGEEMIDPDTGESLGQEEAEVGSMKITTVQSRIAKADLIENFGVEKGFIARLDEQTIDSENSNSSEASKTSLKDSLDF
jgi:hypothetical protein